MKLLLLAILFPSFILFGQTDSTKNEKFSVHFQITGISQDKPSFDAKYSGSNSLHPWQETQSSLTSTLFLGARLWKGASIFYNPEVAGGSGLSGALGVASSTNGETYRVGNPNLTLALARLYFRQVFSLSPKEKSVDPAKKMKGQKYEQPDENQLGGISPEKYFALTFGKICVADFFDNNSFSHDPRTQFMSWGLMSNGAWDYPANVRGYTPSAALEFVSPKNELRYDISLVPKSANSNDMNWNIAQASGQSLEYTRNFILNKKSKGAIRLLGFYNTANMGNYSESIALALANSTTPDITQTRQYGRSKYGFGINGELESPNKLFGIFIRAGWNDGNNESWMFTEIDQTTSAGFIVKGKKWKRPNDVIGIADVISGLSSAHRDYLQEGGKGFMLGDGNLNYGYEQVSEVYYSFAIFKNNIALTAAYQLVNNPGYNKDRGPVNVFSLRIHAEI